MADLITLCGALATLFGFVFLVWFIRRLGILEMNEALLGDEFLRPKMDPQPMVEVQNPFKMTVSSSNTLGYVELIVSCTHSCYINCYWKVKKQTLDQRVSDNQSDNNSGDNSESIEENKLETVLENNYETLFDRQFSEACTEKILLYNIEEIMNKSGDQPDLPSDPLQYHLLVTMELTRENKDEMENSSSIVAMLVGINLKKQVQHFKPLVVQQYIQSLNGQLFKLKKLFLEESSNASSEQSSSSSSLEQDQSLCVVCQTLPISRALIPCGHACLCVLCFDKMNACPMCRHLITSSFILREEPNVHEPSDRQFSEILKRMNPVEIIKGIYNAS